MIRRTAALSLAVLTLAALTIAGLRLAVDAPARLAHPVTPPGPYAGTPAEDFAEGVAGVVLPPARDLPNARLVSHHPRYETVTAEEVAEMLERTRDAIVATRIDDRMLTEHDPTPYLDSQAPHLRRWWTDPTHPARVVFENPDVVIHWATKLAPGVTPAAPPRVSVEVEYEATETVWGYESGHPDRVVEIRTRGTYVYALESPELDGVSLLVLRDEQIFRWPVDYRISGLEWNVGLHHRRGESITEMWNADCGAYAAGLIRPSHPESDPFADAPDECPVSDR